MSLTLTHTHTHTDTTSSHIFTHTGRPKSICLDDANNGGVCEWHPGLNPFRVVSNSVAKANDAIESMNPLNDTHLPTAGENKAGDATLQQSPIVPVVVLPQHHFQVTVPPGTMFGQQLQVPSPDGQLIQFAVPAVAPGTVISVPYTPLGSQ